MRDATLTVGPCRPTDEPFLWAIYDDAFVRHTAPGALAYQLESFGEQMASGAVSVARIGDEPVGFGVVERVRPTGQVYAMLRVWRYPAMTPEVKGWLLAKLDGRTAKPTLRRFHRDVDWNALLERSAFFTAMAVDGRHRRRGIGTALAGYRLERARKSGCPAVFVTCVAGSGSAELYDKLGFERILEVGSWYPDGAGVVLMGRALRRPAPPTA